MKFEYKIRQEMYIKSDYEDGYYNQEKNILNEEGKSGWELVQINTQERSTYHVCYYYFKNTY